MRIVLAFAAVCVMAGYAADLNRGVQLYQQGKFKDAESELASVTGAEPRNVGAFRYLALSRIEQNKLAEAEEALNQANELEPDGETNVVVARLATEKKDYEKANEALAKASGAEVDYAKGRLDLARGRNEDAAREFESYLQKTPDSAYAHYYAGMAYNGVRRQDKMLTHFELFVQMKPDAPEARKVRAVLQTGR